jgi:hypothetical protein
MNVAPLWHVLTFILIYYNLNILDMLYWTSWSLVGPGVEVGLTPSFINYVVLSLK